jgi:hypothetical protein
VSEELLYIGHRPKQLHGLIEEWQETLSLIKVARSIILRIHDYSKRSSLASGNAPERISQQKATVTSALEAPINSQTP